MLRKYRIVLWTTLPGYGTVLYHSYRIINSYKRPEQVAEKFMQGGIDVPFMFEEEINNIWFPVTVWLNNEDKKV